MLAGNLVGGLSCLLAWGLAWLLTKANLPAVAVVYPSLILIPCAIGLAAAWVWTPLKLGIGLTLLHSLSCTLLGLGAAYLCFREGAVCLLIIAPILYIGTAIGALAGRIWFRKASHHLNLCLAPLVIFAVAAEPSIRGPHTGVVTDEIRIAAPPAKVWPHVCAFPPIAEAPGYWLFRLGLPYQVDE
jgi:hypothetical protein